MESKHTEFYPFYDSLYKEGTISYATKIGISLGFGTFYILLQYFSLPDKIVFFQQYCWILGVIISTSIMALYIATDVFRRSLVTMSEFAGDNRVSNQVVETWLNNKWYFFVGAIWATSNTTIGHLLGVPGVIHDSAIALSVQYVGFTMAGFSAGMGVWAIVAVIVLYLKFAPSLQHSLDPNNPDGNGGIKKLGDSLWFFAILTFVLGVLISIYMFGVQWEFMYKGYVRLIFFVWLALPYLVAISIVLVPGLAVRRQVNQYKNYKIGQLKQQKAQFYTSYKEFREGDDDQIIATKKELNEKLNHIQEQMDKLKKMRDSHIDGKTKD